MSGAVVMTIFLAAAGQRTPPQSPAQATHRIQTLTNTPWWLHSPSAVQKIWNVYLRGGHDCTLAGARDRACFFFTERETCGNDEFMFGAVGPDVLLDEFGVLACTQERRDAEALMKKWRSIIKPPKSARVTKRPDERLKLTWEYTWDTATGTTTMLLSASAYTEYGWQVHLYVSLKRATP